jgi:hypothetical protein
MATTRRDRNRNFFKWEPVEDGNNRFTPNAPPNWFYELVEPADSLSEDEDRCTPDIGSLRNTEDVVATKQLLRMTPSNEELLKAARNSPPPPEWFNEDEERPF